jgi:hypothetical protein
MFGSRKCNREDIVALDEVAERDEICSHLLEFVLTATDDEIAGIARFDSHAGPSEHKRHCSELTKVLSEQSGIFTEEQNWYPSEAVELCAYHQAKGWERHWRVASCLLMINALHREDDMDWMSTRWKLLATDYLAMPVPVRIPILRGFRWLADAVEHWDPWSHEDLVIAKKRKTRKERRMLERKKIRIAIPTKDEIAAMAR